MMTYQTVLNHDVVMRCAFLTRVTANKCIFIYPLCDFICTCSYLKKLIRVDCIQIENCFQSWSSYRMHIIMRSRIRYTFFLYVSRTLLPSASSGYTIGRLSFTQLLTSVIGIPISLSTVSVSSSLRFCGLPLGRLSSGWIMMRLLYSGKQRRCWCHPVIVTTTWSYPCLLCW